MKNFRDEGKYYPTLVHDIDGHVGGDDSFQKIQKLHALPQKTQDLLLSDKIGEFIYGMEQRYHFHDAQTEEFSRTVRQYFFREITEGRFAQKIAALCKISPDEALTLLRAISAIQPHRTDKVIKREKISLDKALKKYPQILQQVVTGKPIVTKPFLKPLKPTVKNWIMVYEKILDVSAHSMIERGNFVFRSAATKGLSEDERRALLTIFKSRDEGFKIIIDPDEKKIIFTKEKIQEKNQKNSSRQSEIVKKASIIHEEQQKPQQKDINTISYIARTQNKNTDDVINHQSVDGKLNNKKITTYSKNPQLQKNTNAVQQGMDMAVDTAVPKNIIAASTDNNLNQGRIKQTVEMNGILPQKKEKSINDKQKTDAVLGAVNEIGELHHEMQDQSHIYQKTVHDSPKKNVLHTDVQKEITKNRVEMGKNDKKSNSGVKEWEKENKKIGTQTYDKKQKIAKNSIVFDEKDSHKQTGVGVLSHKEKNVSTQKKNKKQTSPKKKAQSPIVGKISFSSNHVMPAEKTKKIQQKKQYNTFNMKPMGQTHRVDNNSNT